jgi:hypothetical protein
MEPTMPYVTEYAPTMRANVVKIIDKRDAKCVTLTGRIVILTKGDGGWCGLNAGDTVEIQEYNRNVSLFGKWIVVDPTPVKYEPPPARRVSPPVSLSAPVRPPMPDPAKRRSERFQSAPANVPFRDLEAEREDLRRMRGK